MLVREEIQFLVKDEQVEELLMHDLEIADRFAGFWIRDGEGQLHWLSRLDPFRRRHDVQVVFDCIGKARYELHAAAGTLARTLLPHIGVHGAYKLDGLFWRLVENCRAFRSDDLLPENRCTGKQQRAPRYFGSKGHTAVVVKPPSTAISCPVM